VSFLGDKEIVAEAQFCHPGGFIEYGFISQTTSGLQADWKSFSEGDRNDPEESASGHERLPIVQSDRILVDD
jgi:hypothetical protein